MIPIRRDSEGQPYIQWEQAPGGYKRAWISHREGGKDWAGTRRYLTIARTAGPDSGPAPGPDFPIFKSEEDFSDEQILISFVTVICALTDSEIPRIPIAPTA